MTWLCGVLDSGCLVVLILALGLLAELLQHCHARLVGLTPYPATGLMGAVCLAVCERFPALHQQVLSLVWLLGIAVVVAGVRMVCQYAQSRLVVEEVSEAAGRLRRAIYRQTHRLGSTEFSGIGATPAIRLFTEEAERVREGLRAWLGTLIREPVRVVLLLVVALSVHWALTLLMLVLAALGAFVTVRVMHHGRQQAEAAVQGAEQRLALLQESLRMIRLTRGYLMESHEQERFERHLQEQTAADTRRLLSQGAANPVAEFLTVVVVSLMAGLASLNLLAGVLSAGATVVFYAAMVSLYWPAAALWRAYGQVRAGAEAAAPIMEFLDRQAQLVEVAGAAFLAPMRRCIEFDSVRVIEPGGPVLLDGINLQIPAGSRTAVMGLDEQSKRALVFLIPRFLDPTDGQVRIDGQNLQLVTLESLRAQVALVLQDALVFNDTVAGNIGCGEPGYELPHIVEAAKVAHAHQFIQRLPDGYDTVIGDHGEHLSAGQQFRIALARAILRDPTIVVIEEPRPNLDADTKKLLDDTMERFARGRTVIFLPHRLSTIRSCDRIVLLHEGRIETTGNHRELTHQSELYRHLQYTEFNVYVR